jgi:hypothetical protein
VIGWEETQHIDCESLICVKVPIVSSNRRGIGLKSFSSSFGHFDGVADHKRVVSDRQVTKLLLEQERKWSRMEVGTGVEGVRANVSANVC